MLAALIVVFREILEIGLVISIVMAATKHVPGRGLWVGCGILGGTLGAGLLALFANAISAAMEGVGQELFTAAILLIAVVMLVWHNIWMARNGREAAADMKAVGDEVTSGRRSAVALSVVTGTAVLRDGSEIVLFLYGIALSGNDVPMMVTGGLAGLALGACVSALMYFGLAHIPTRHLFRVTSWLIALLAAGMAAQAVALLQQAQVVTILTKIVWNTSGFISNASLTGKVLHTMIGYTAQPTALQLIVQVLTLAVIFALMQMFGHVSKAQKSGESQKFSEKH